VGCERCHGGDATTFESMLAHRNVLNSANPASPVNRRNLSTTCGTCHAGPFVAFRKSQHFALLEKGDSRVPVCSTCHGAAGYSRPSARALETQCAQCHGPNRIAPRAERAEAARVLYGALHESRDLMKTTRSLVGRVSDKRRRAELDEAYQQAEVPLVQAVQAGHEFVYDALKERLSVARVKEAADAGAEVLATACPVCVQMFEDALAVTGLQGTLEVRDTSELVSRAMGVTVRH